VEIGAAYMGSCKPQSCQKQKDNYSTGYKAAMKYVSSGGFMTLMKATEYILIFDNFVKYKNISTVLIKIYKKFTKIQDDCNLLQFYYLFIISFILYHIIGRGDRLFYA